MPKRRRWVLAGAGALALLILGWTVLMPGWRPMPLGHGGEARVRPATFIRSIFPEASCTIEYRPAAGQAGMVELWQDMFDGPILLMPSTNANILLCLYDFDVDLRLFRINTAEPFKPVQPEFIKSILFTSSWEIACGTVADWDEMEGYLTNAPTADYELHRIPAGRFNYRPARAWMIRNLQIKNRFPQ